MANRLQKVATLVYTPSSSYVVQAPGYYVYSSYTLPGHYSAVGSTSITSATANGGSIGLTYNTFYLTPTWVPPQTFSTQTYVQPQPQTVYSPATIRFVGQTGWNGGASSLAPLVANGDFSFQVKSFPSPMSVGVGAGNLTTLPSEPSHSLYFSGTSVVVQERGVTVYTPPAFSHDYAIVYKISRTGAALTLSAKSGAVTVWSYTSTLPSYGELYLDAAIYAAGDYVDNPVMTPAPLTGTASGSFAPLVGFAYKTTSGRYASAIGALPPLTGSALSVGRGSGAGALPAIFGVAADRPYAGVTGSFAPLVGTADGGYPQITLLTAFGAFEAPVGISLGTTGEVGSVVASFPRMAGMAGDYDYGAVTGSFALMTGYADQGVAVNVPGFSSDNLIDVTLIGSFFIASDSYGARLPDDSLEVGDFWEAFDVVDGDVIEALVLADSLTVQQAIEAVIQSTLSAGNNITSAVRVELPGGVIPGEPLQYAVNVLTGALTTYSGFGFDQYARTEQTLYGCRSDGVYRIRRGDDDGEPLQAHVDFGESVYGSTKIKTVESVYLGVTTDGSITARVAADGAERLYRVVPRGTLYRALTAKGVPGRTWGVSLEIVDATEFELDVLEVQVGITSGRWRSR